MLEELVDIIDGRIDSNLQKKHKRVRHCYWGTAQYSSWCDHASSLVLTTHAYFMTPTQFGLGGRCNPSSATESGTPGIDICSIHRNAVMNVRAVMSCMWLACISDVSGAKHAS